MFVLSTLSDSHVRVLPENLGKPRVEALSDAIEQIYVDKVHDAPRVFCRMAASREDAPRATVAVATAAKRWRVKRCPRQSIDVSARCTRPCIQGLGCSRGG